MRENSEIAQQLLGLSKDCQDLKMRKEQQMTLEKLTAHRKKSEAECLSDTMCARLLRKIKLRVLI